MLAEISAKRRFIVTGILVFFSMWFLMFFTESDSVSTVLQKLIVSIIFFLVIPLLYSKMVLREPLGNLGWQKGNTSAGIITGIIALIIGGGVVLSLAYAYPAFRAEYQLPVVVARSFFWFVVYELALTSFLVLLYEVFFRGLTQMLWLRDRGWWAVVVQAVIFYGFSYLGNDFSWQRAPLLIFCPLAGIIAYRSQSIWYSFIASWLFIFLTDVFFLSVH
jgi:membrane protease YdiL (CAAX protease family)